MARARTAVTSALIAAAGLACLAPQRGPATQSTADRVSSMWSAGRAQGEGPVQLTNFPLRIADLDFIVPMGQMASGHTTPRDHLSLVAKTGTAPDKTYDVLAVADGYLVNIQWRPNPPGGQPDPTVFDRAVDLKLVFEHAKNCWSYVDHLVEVDPAILQPAGVQPRPGQPLQVRVPVKAGQVVGKVYGGRTFDFALIDTRVTLQGFLAPEQFLARDPWKPHTVDPFDYLDAAQREKYLAFNPRKDKPFGGKIDYDVDGRLVGNWYRQNSGGYAGLNGRLDYWVGHLTIAYHHVDPSQIIISIGELDGKAQQFQVRGNKPDPAKIGEEDGLVKYELIAPTVDNRTGKPYAGVPERFYGVLLVQLQKGRKLKLQAIRGKTAAEVSGFTDAALLYER